MDKTVDILGNEAHNIINEMLESANVQTKKNKKTMRKQRKEDDRTKKIEHYVVKLTCIVISCTIVD